MATNLFDRLHQGQKELAREILSMTRENIVVNCGRTWGKDTVEVVLLLNLIRKGYSIGVFSHIHDDNRKLFKLIKKVDKEQALDYHASAPLEIRHPQSGGSIRFKSFETAENLRGENFFDILFINEAARLSDSDWDNIVQPITNTTKMNVFVSTPRPVKWYKSLFKAGIESPSKYCWSKHAPTTDNPHIDRTKLERIRMSVAPLVWNQEYEAIFVEGSGDVFQNYEHIFCNDGYGARTELMFVGIDIAKNTDYTVVVVLNEFGQLHYKDRFHKLDWDELQTRIVAPLADMDYPKGYIEENGIGMETAWRVSQACGNRLIRVFTTNRPKEDAVNGLIMSINSGFISYPKDDENLKLELGHFQVKINQDSNIYGAATGYHDDEIIALALANRAYTNPAWNPRFAV